jgi:hypothetical protein
MDIRRQDNPDKKGHYKNECPYNDRPRTGVTTPGASSSILKPTEVNMLELTKLRTKNKIPEVMMAKRGAPTQDLDPSTGAHHKRSKHHFGERSSYNGKRHPRQRIGLEDMPISRNQNEYSIVSYLSC